MRILDRLKRMTPKQEAEKRKELTQVEVSWKDRLAMVVSAYVVLLIPALIVIVVISLLGLLLFGVL